jgi:hypothetical protein
MALSAPLLTRKQVIKIKLEAAMGTQIETDQAILVYDLDIKPTSPYEQRKGSGLYLGNNNPGILGERSGTCTFKIELRGTGSNGLEAGLAILLQACGFIKTLEVYSLAQTVATQKTITIEVWEDGAHKAIYGAMGNVRFTGQAGKKWILDFAFSGIWATDENLAGLADEAMPAWTPATTTPLKLEGGTFTLATLAIKIASFELDMQNVVAMRGSVTGTGGIAHYAITDNDPQIGIDPEADLVAGYDYYGAYFNGTEAAVSLVLGATDTVTFTLPKVQYKEVTPGDRSGIKIYNITGQCNHSTGGDAVSIAVT